METDRDDRIKKYEYVMKPAEIREFCLAALWEQAKCRKGVGLRLLIIIVLEFLFLPEAAALIVIMVAVVYLGAGIYNYTATAKLLEGQPICVWLQDGRLKAEREDYSEVACQHIQFIRMTRHLLMLGYMQTVKRPVWFVMPLRIFENVQERETFLARVRNPQDGFGAGYTGDRQERAEQADGYRAESAGTMVQEMTEAVPQEYMRFSYILNGERWVRFQKGAADVLNSGSLGGPIRIRAMIIWGSVMAAACISAAYVVAGTLNWMLVCFCLAITLWMILRIYYRNPEKNIRKQLKSPDMCVRLCGQWQVSLTEKGISVSMPAGMMNFCSWKSLAWLVETEEAFYIFYKDKKHFIMIAKESFVSWEQVDLFHRICMDKGLPKIMAKKAHYMPAWASWLMLGMILLVSLLVLTLKIFQDSGKGEAHEYGELVVEHKTSVSFAPQGRVPLDKQVEILESLGLHVPQETAEAVRDAMEEYDLYDMVEESPYTWLLMDMGGPVYDEEWNLTGYAEDVFWFDFEGIDIYTDYIEVLNGMLALAKDSPLEGVCNIEENTDEMDWEQGSGTITVSVDWNGQTYLYDMEVYYDWIDEKVLGILNSLPVQEASQKRFYVTGDDGQGAIVFFCTPDWAEQFSRKTGLVLESCTIQPDDIQKKSD